MNGYNAEACSSCAAPAAAVLLEDHGHVIAAACARHRARLIEAWTPALFVLEVRQLSRTRTAAPAPTPR